jgi:hypothetical protein
MSLKNRPDCSPIVSGICAEIPLEELEDRLEMQQVPALDPSLACYTDLCPSHCATHCAAGYTGCPDLCGCDGTKCLTQCGELCMVESCFMDIV